jgi:hypothetical protein
MERDGTALPSPLQRPWTYFLLWVLHALEWAANILWSRPCLSVCRICPRRLAKCVTGSHCCETMQPLVIPRPRLCCVTLTCVPVSQNGVECLPRSFSTHGARPLPGPVSTLSHFWRLRPLPGPVSTLSHFWRLRPLPGPVSTLGHFALGHFQSLCPLWVTSDALGHFQGLCPLWVTSDALGHFQGLCPHWVTSDALGHFQGLCPHWVTSDALGHFQGPCPLWVTSDALGHFQGLCPLWVTSDALGHFQSLCPLWITSDAYYKPR